MTLTTTVQFHRHLGKKDHPLHEIEVSPDYVLPRKGEYVQLPSNGGWWEVRRVDHKYAEPDHAVIDLWVEPDMNRTSV